MTDKKQAAYYKALLTVPSSLELIDVNNYCRKENKLLEGSVEVRVAC